jgi:hypothetical protein
MPSRVRWFGCWARRVARRADASLGTERFWTSGDPTRKAPIMSVLWGQKVNVMALPKHHGTFGVAGSRG